MNVEQPGGQYTLFYNNALLKMSSHHYSCVAEIPCVSHQGLFFGVNNWFFHYPHNRTASDEALAPFRNSVGLRQKSFRKKLISFKFPGNSVFWQDMGALDNRTTNKQNNTWAHRRISKIYQNDIVASNNEIIKLCTNTYLSGLGYLFQNPCTTWSHVKWNIVLLSKYFTIFMIQIHIFQPKLECKVILL